MNQFGEIPRRVSAHFYHAWFIYIGPFFVREEIEIQIVIFQWTLEG